MTYIELSNDMVMTKGKEAKKTIQRPKADVRPDVSVKEAPVVYRKSRQPASPKTFTVTRGDKQKSYSIQTGFGYFIPSLRKAENLGQVNELVEAGIPSREVKAIIEYLNLKVPEIARAAAVSPSTVSRWKSGSSIGVPGSNQFFRIDEVIRKGVELFGGLEEFRNWLYNPNLALGNVVPAKLITSHVGIEIVDEALDALHYGNVM